MHAGHTLHPAGLWSAWHFDPVVLPALAVAGFIYARGVSALRQSAGAGHGIASWRVASFHAGLLVVALAVASPLDPLSDALLSAHMSQHLLLMLVAAPLLAAGAPVLGMLWSLSPDARRFVGAWWMAQARLRAAVRWVVAPVVAGALHSLAVWFWHVPASYDLAVRNGAAHTLEHATFAGSAVLFWWAVVGLPATRRASPARLAVLLGMVFVVAMQGAALGALMTLSSSPWYASHLTSTRIWGLTPVEDQQLAGAIMWAPTGVVYLAAFVALARKALERARLPLNYQT